MSHDAHGEHPYMGHHWETADQQYGAAKLGMWLFMAQEILFFSGLFCYYAVLRYNDPAVFQWGAKFLDTKWGAINTIVLLASSLTMALAVRAAQLNQRKLLCWMLALTFLGGCGFMAIKTVEYQSKFDHGTIFGLYGAKKTTVSEEEADAGAVPENKPGFSYEKIYEHNVQAEEPQLVAAELRPLDTTAVDRSQQPPPSLAPEGTLSPEEIAAVAHGHGAAGEHEEHDGKHHTVVSEPPPNAHRFFSVYFGLTGLHGLHVLIGMGLIAWIFFNSLAGKYSDKYYTQVDIVGLYWHLVDLIWIFLFPLLYLIH